ncbi:MAG: cobaltochelatase subunit CobN, partial [Deltaproteobacteria bacterium]|nr:cobaltochelatase subunit CobN [Deltaproteobacteria bacterium]
SVQPKRGCAGARCDGKVCKILHDPDVLPPHHYVATYRYLQDVFGADVIIHVGTHGNLEFLPGKKLGLSENCLPDLCLFEAPHLYVYNSDNPSEGIIAKRRSYATLCDHLQTVQGPAAGPEEFRDLDALLAEWEKEGAAGGPRDPELARAIKNETERLKLDLMTEDPGPDFENHVHRARETIALVRGTLVQDGLHVFGEIPEGRRLARFLHSILRNDRGPDSLAAAAAAALGADLEKLAGNPDGFDDKTFANFSAILAKVEELSLEIIAVALGTEPGEPRTVVVRNVLEALGGTAKDPGALARGLEKPLKRLDGIRKRLARSREIDSLLNAMAGNHTPPGPSGLITKGREDIIPTGRNFFASDPGRLPSPAGTVRGKKLADGLIEKFLSEEGRHPENVAIFWMCNDLMWADGECLAQILALIGATPARAADGKVAGVIPVPLAELGRPRIDVTIRVSGLLRDSFPGAIDLVDGAVRAVAALNEDPESNFVRKHALERMKKSRGDPDAFRNSTRRIFCSAPGTYGAGVALAVAASAWRTEKDLADVFLLWNDRTYGEDGHGIECPGALRDCLSTVDVTFCKTASDESDLLACSGHHSAHGGLAAAAKSLRGNGVKNYYGDTRDASRVTIRTLADEMRRVAGTKLLNRNWIEGLKRHGYKGAGDISKRVSRLCGWKAATGEADDRLFDELAKTFVLDDDNREFFVENNPHALEEILRRLLEAAARGLWKAPADLSEKLKEHYLRLEGVMEELAGPGVGNRQGGAINVFVKDSLADAESDLNPAATTTLADKP